MQGKKEKQQTYQNHVRLRPPLALTQVDLPGDGTERVGYLGVHLIGEHNAADPNIQHVVHDAHEHLRITTRGTVHAACWKVHVGDAVGCLPEVVELVDEIVDHSLVCIIIYGEESDLRI